MPKDCVDPRVYLRLLQKRGRKTPLFDHLVGAGEQRDELAPLDELIELHSIPEPGPDCRISNWRRIVSGF
jgi:hypothetical protein